jgi:membrane protein
MGVLLIFLRCFCRKWQQALLFTHASSLTFSTILAIVPLMVVTATLFSLLALTSDVQLAIQNYIFNNFVVSVSHTIQTYLQTFERRAWQLSWWGIGFLMLNVVSILFSLARGINDIWQVSSRTYLKALGLYFVIVLICPLCVAASFAGSLCIASIDYFIWLRSFSLPFTFLLPLVLSFVGFTLAFKIMPNCKVSWQASAIGGVTAMFLFECAKTIFTWYVKSFPTYERIYGVLAALPLFFLWLYFCWLIFFVGALIAYFWQTRGDHPLC